MTAYRKYILILVLLLSVYKIGYAEYYVTTGQLNLREGAGSNFNSKATLQKGDTVKFIEDFDVNWFIVVFHSDTGYISKHYLEKIDYVEPAKIETPSNIEKEEDSEQTGSPIFILFFLAIITTISIIAYKVGKKKRNLQDARTMSFVCGAIGLHWFYLGDIKRGVFYVAICWTTIPMIIAIFDLVQLLQMDNSNFDLKYNPINRNNSNFHNNTYITPANKIQNASLNTWAPPPLKEVFKDSQSFNAYTDRNQKKFYYYFRDNFYKGIIIDLMGEINYAKYLFYIIKNSYNNGVEFTVIYKQLNLLLSIAPSLSFEITGFLTSLYNQSSNITIESNKSIPAKNDDTVYVNNIITNPASSEINNILSSLSAQSSSKTIESHDSLPTKDDKTIVRIDIADYNTKIPIENNYSAKTTTPPYWNHFYVYSKSDLQNANTEQKRFYYYLKEKVINGEYVDINFQYNYAFILLFDLIDDYHTHLNYTNLEKQLSLLCKICPKTRSYATVELRNLFKGNPDAKSIEILQNLHDFTYLFSIGLTDYNPDLYKLGTRYKNTFDLSDFEFKYLNKFYDPTNSFTEYESFILAVIKLYSSVLKSYFDFLESNSSTIEKEIDNIFSFFKIKNTSTYYKDYLNSNKDDLKNSLESDIYLGIFKRCENKVRDQYGHKRKITHSLIFGEENYDDEFQSSIGIVIDSFIDSNVDKIPEPTIESQIILNSLNVNRWKDEFKPLINFLTVGKIEDFHKGICHLEKANANNKNIEHIFFEASKSVTKYDRVLALIYYAKYIYYDLSSPKIDNLPLTATAQRELFKNDEQLNDYKKIITDLISSRNIDEAIERIKNIYLPKKKRIKIDKEEVVKIEFKHNETVNLLNKYLEADPASDESLSERNIANNTNAQADQNSSETSSNFTKNSLNVELSSQQTELISIIISNSFSISQKEVNEFATKNGLFKNQLIDSINDAFFDKLDGSALIEEDDENYIIDKTYYSELNLQIN